MLRSEQRKARAISFWSAYPESRRVSMAYFPQRDPHVVVGDDHSMNENHTPRPLGMEANAIIDDDDAGGRRAKLEKNLLFW
jgi:hypothetical protein